MGGGGALEAPGVASRRRSYGIARVIKTARSRTRKVGDVKDNLRGVNLEGERHLILDNSETSTTVRGRYKGKREKHKNTGQVSQGCDCRKDVVLPLNR